MTHPKMRELLGMPPLEEEAKPAAAVAEEPAKEEVLDEPELEIGKPDAEVAAEGGDEAGDGPDAEGEDAADEEPKPDAKQGRKGK